MKRTTIVIAGASALAIAAVAFWALRGSRANSEIHSVDQSTATAQTTLQKATIPQEALPESTSVAVATPQKSAPSALLAMMNDEDPEFSQLAKNELDTFLLLTKDLPVDETTARALSQDLARARAAQLLYQGAIAKIVPESSERTRVEVPAYPAEGRALMDFINQGLVRTLPSTKSVAEFWDKKLDVEFNYLGRHSQELIFTRDDRARRNNAVEITTTISTGNPGIIATDKSFLRLSRLGSFAVYSGAIPQGGTQQ